MATPPDDGIRITAYRDDMRSRVVSLICSEYGGSAQEREQRFVRFYEHPFQRDRCIRLVALDGDRVVGLQAYCYWPYCCGDERFASYQSGSSLVARDYRGRGIFARLLGHLDWIEEKPRIDFLMGFPVAPSFGSFLRNGWANPLDLTWYARLTNPLAILMPADVRRMQMQFDAAPALFEPYRAPDAFSLATDKDFQAWRQHYRDGALYHYFHYASPLGLVRFDLKRNRRGRIAELIIGDVVLTSPDPALLQSAMRDLIRATHAHRSIAVLTIALNPHLGDAALVRCVQRSLFVRMRRKIRFVIKRVRPGCDAIENPARWRLLRGDIDSW